MSIKITRKKLIFIVLIVVVVVSLVLTISLSFSKKPDADLPANETVNNERYPSFVVETVNASKGEEDVIVYVSLKDNPGFLTMAMDITYDSENMTLVKAVSGTDYSDYNFVGPKNADTGCTASWFIPDVPDEIIDGKILELHFDVNNDIKSGSYLVSVTRPENGGIVDENKEPIIFNNATGYINIK